jgi:hypothetical protein
MTGLLFACGSVPPGTTHDNAIGQAGPSILSNGLLAWKDKDGRTLKELEAV